MEFGIDKKELTPTLVADKMRDESNTQTGGGVSGLNFF